MEWSIILLGAFTALFMALMSSSPKQLRKRAIVDPVIPVDTTYPDIPIYPRSIPTQQPQHVPATDGRIPPKTMLQTWQNSIVGLIKLAQKNLIYARTCLDRGDYKAVVEAAVTSTENMSRALLHCYGEKPELNSGQEEALWLLARRFTGNEKEGFENAIGEITQLNRNSVVHRYLSKHSVDFSFALFSTKSRTMPILASASKVVTHFYQIIDEHFATEIPELGNACPRCHALDVSVLSRSKTNVNYMCSQCGHRWIDRELSG